jgi:hypothetical protein
LVKIILDVLVEGDDDDDDDDDKDDDVEMFVGDDETSTKFVQFELFNVRSIPFIVVAKTGRIEYIELPYF